MKKFKIRKRLLALLMSGNILLTGCSIANQKSLKEEETSLEQESSYTSINEFSYDDNSKKEELKNSEVESKEELSSTIESSVKKIDEDFIFINEVSNEVSEEASIEESSELENSIELKEESSKNSKEISIEESSENKVSSNEIYTNDNKYIQAITDVNLRSEPNTKSKILTLLNKGSYLKKIGYINDWYIVDYNGINAYISKDYTKEIDESLLNKRIDEYNICYFPYGATLYSDSNMTNKIIDIPSLESGQIYYQEGNTYNVDTYGYNGYVSVSSTTIIPQPVVIVDKSEQMLRFYKNDSMIMEFPVVTGNETNEQYTPSTEGLFDIKCKNYNSRLVGPEINGVPEWDVVVNVFMEYYNGEGIHDAVWRGYFGGDIYQGNGSHGCINCPYDEVMALASEVEVEKTKKTRILIKR